MLRFIFNLLRFRRADERRGGIRRDLQATHDAQRAKADYSSQDYYLKRDLAGLEDKDKRKR